MYTTYLIRNSVSGTLGRPVPPAKLVGPSSPLRGGQAQAKAQAMARAAEALATTFWASWGVIDGK
jgi:hypothetical protein